MDRRQRQAALEAFPSCVSELEHTLTAVWHMPQACVMTAACRVLPCLSSAVPPHLVTHTSHPT